MLLIIDLRRLLRSIGENDRIVEMIERASMIWGVIEAFSFYN